MQQFDHSIHSLLEFKKINFWFCFLQALNFKFNYSKFLERHYSFHQVLNLYLCTLKYLYTKIIYLYLQMKTKSQFHLICCYLKNFLFKKINLIVLLYQYCKWVWKCSIIKYQSIKVFFQLFHIWTSAEGAVVWSVYLNLSYSHKNTILKIYKYLFTKIYHKQL